MDTLLRKHFWIVYLLLAGLCAFFVGKSAAHLLRVLFASAPTQPRTMPGSPSASMVALERKLNTTGLSQKNPFCPGCDLPSDADPKAADRGPTRSSLPYRLQLTLIEPKWQESAALVQGKGEKEFFVWKRGDDVPDSPGSKVLQVSGPTDEKSARVYLLVDNRIEYIDSEADDVPTPPIARGKSTDDLDLDNKIRCKKPGMCEVDREFWKKFLSNITAMAGSINVVPATSRDGRPAVRLSFRPNSPLARIGMKSGDLLQTINNAPLTNASEGLLALVRLQDADRFTIVVERNGQPVTLEAQIR